MRRSAADASLRPVRGRDNLTVRTGVQVARVVIDGGRAVGVEARVDGRMRVARVEGQVILSAGAVNSPQLLQLSGIGDPDHLRRVGIEPTVELPSVGHHLQDHAVAPAIFYEAGELSLDDAPQPRDVLELLMRRSGRLTTNAAEAGGFLRSDDALEAPDLQLLFVPGFFHDHGRTPAPARCLSMGTILLQPESRGSVAITTADPFAPPAIQAGYLASDRDLDVLEAACARTLRFADAPPLCHHIRGRHLPRDTSADALRRHIREELVTTYHPTSTCRMGDGPHAVVDPELRVRGVEGLRVADASIMPTITRGNTHAPTVMIAETASDLIRGRPAPAPAPV